MKQIFFVGLSFKNDKAGEQIPAFDVSTNSGKIIQKIYDEVGQDGVHATNLVPFTPLKDGKIRYPTKEEKAQGLKKLCEEIDFHQAKIVFLFGKEVSDFVFKELDGEEISEGKVLKNGILFIATQHPSYIFVYKRKNIEEYVQGIVEEIYALKKTLDVL